MAMTRLLLLDVSVHLKTYEQGISKAPKVLYISPSKALCGGRYNDWLFHLREINNSITCSRVTGDGEIDPFQEAATSNVILTTPQKWDAITR